MSTEAFRDIRGYLCSTSTITDLVDKTDIKIGWPKELDSFPCILITQTGGMDYGYLGYKTAAAGSKFRREETTLQLDIFSTTSRKETYAISDAIVPIMIASGGCRKISDSDTYDSEKNVYRKLQSYSFLMFHDD